MAEMNLPMKYNLLARLKKNLPEKEIEQLIDYIIVKYLPFDYQELVSYYESYDTMLTAMHSNTGSEHDIREEWEPESDLAYAEMIRYIRQSRPGMVVRRVTTLAEAEKVDLAMELQRRTSGNAGGTGNHQASARYIHHP